MTYFIPPEIFLSDGREVQSRRAGIRQSSIHSDGPIVDVEEPDRAIAQTRAIGAP